MKYKEKNKWNFHSVVSRCGPWHTSSWGDGNIYYYRNVTNGLHIDLLFSLNFDTSNIYVYDKEVMKELEPIIKMWEKYSGEEVTVDLGEYEELPCP